MKVIIDRFEGDFAIVELENKKFVNMSKHLLPQDAKEGAVIVIEINEVETKNRRDKTLELMQKVRND